MLERAKAPTMRRTQHGEYLTQLTLFPRWFPVNCYLVREDDGLTLVDTTLSRGAAGIVAAANALNLPIKRIVLTHAHADHVGGLDALAALLPDAQIIAGARDARFLHGDMSLDDQEPQTKLRGSFQTTKTQPSRLVHPGELVGSLRVIEAPGHTPGHIALFDERDGSLIAGDAWQTRGGIAVSGTLRWLFPFPALATWHKPTALRSAKVLRALEPTHLAVGHGDVLADPLAAMDRAIAAAERTVGAS
jgi:glyoxylase-like metal-dependent hydrolase (beta-lactamase superfamily II)